MSDVSDCVKSAVIVLITLVDANRGRLSIRSRGENGSACCPILPKTLDNQPLSDCVKNDFRRIVEVEFLHEVGSMGLYRGQPEIQQRRDLLV